MEVWGGSQLTTRNVQMGGLDAWVYSKPFGDAAGGGDIYYASSCATGRINRLLLADVAGHGTTVSTTANQLRTLMRRYVNFLDQTEFVKSMNKQFVTSSGDGVFATAVVTTFFAPTGRLSICNAGHPQPLWYRAALKQWVPLAPCIEGFKGDRRNLQNLPLGILDLVDYEQFDVEMETGDLLLCFTDALTESRDSDGELLGEKGLLRIIRSLPEVPPEQLIDEILKAIAAENAGNLADDDVTLLLLRPNGQPVKVPMRDQLRAAVRVGAALIRSLNPRAERAPLPDFRLANIGGALFPRLARRWRAAKPVVSGQ